MERWGLWSSLCDFGKCGPGMIFMQPIEIMDAVRDPGLMDSPGQNCGSPALVNFRFWMHLRYNLIDWCGVQVPVTHVDAHRDVPQPGSVRRITD